MSQPQGNGFHRGASRVGTQMRGALPMSCVGARSLVQLRIGWVTVPIAPLLPIGMFLGAMAILILRLPEALLHAEFFSDDGVLYSDALARGGATLFETYAGYLVIGQRAVVVLELFVPPAYAPVVGNAMALAATAAVAAYLVTASFPWSRPFSAALAAVLLLAPSNRDLIGTLSHVQWSIAAWLALVPLAKPPESKIGRASETVGLVAAGFTGPFAILFLPLYLFGPRRRLVALGLVAIVQAFVVLNSVRRPAEELALSLVPYVVALRVFVAPTVGPSIAAILPAWAVLSAAATMCAALLIVGRKLPRGVAFRFLYVAAVPVGLGVWNAGWETARFFDPWAHMRYFWFSGLVIGWATVLTWPLPPVRPFRKPASVMLAALICLGMVFQFRHVPRPYQQWSERSSCIGGPTSCVVPVYPGERWSVVYEP